MLGSSIWRRTLPTSRARCLSRPRPLPPLHPLLVVGQHACLLSVSLKSRSELRKTYGALRPTSGRSHVEHDTIYALSSGQGKAGIAVIRISGPATLDVRCSATYGAVLSVF